MLKIWMDGQMVLSFETILDLPFLTRHHCLFLQGIKIPFTQVIHSGRVNSLFYTQLTYQSYFPAFSQLHAGKCPQDTCIITLENNKVQKMDPCFCSPQWSFNTFIYAFCVSLSHLMWMWLYHVDQISIFLSYLVFLSTCVRSLIYVFDMKLLL